MILQLVSDIDAAASFDEDRIRRANTTEENDEDPESLRLVRCYCGYGR